MDRRAPGETLLKTDPSLEARSPRTIIWYVIVNVNYSSLHVERALQLTARFLNVRRTGNCNICQPLFLLADALLWTSEAQFKGCIRVIQVRQSNHT